MASSTAISISISPPLLSLSSLNNQKPRSSLNPTPPLSSPATLFFNRNLTNHHNPPHRIQSKPTKIWRIPYIPQDFLLSEANPVEDSQQIVPAADGGVSTIVNALLFVAFLGLSILTIGVIYIAVTDFLQNREAKKFEKEEAAKRKKKSKRRGRARAGPRGFGQKIDEFNDDFDD